MIHEGIVNYNIMLIYHYFAFSLIDHSFPELLGSTPISLSPEKLFDAFLIQLECFVTSAFYLEIF